MSRELSRSLVVNTLWSFIGRFGYLTVGLLTNIVLVRLLSPNEFGQLGIIMFFIAIGNILTESGLSGALVRKKDVTETDYSTIFIFNLAISIVLVLILCILSKFIANFYKDPQLQYLLIASSAVLIINAFRIVQNTRLIRNLEFKKKATYDLIAILLASVISIILAAKGAGTWALIALQLLLSIFSTLLLWIFVGPLKSFEFSFSSFKGFYKFGMNTTLASILNTGFDNVYQLVLGKYFSIAQTGYYFQAKSLQNIPANIIVMLTSGPIYAVLSKLQDSPEEFNRTYHEITRAFTIITALICLTIFIYAEFIVLLLYGEEWLESATYMKLLIIASFFYILEMINRNIFKIFDRTERILQLEILKKTMQSLTIVYGIFTMSISNLLYGFILISILSYMLNYFFAKKIKNTSSYKDLTIVIKVILVAVGTVILTYTLKGNVQRNIVDVLIEIPCIFLFYITALNLARVVNIKNDFRNISQLLKRKSK